MDSSHRGPNLIHTLGRLAPMPLRRLARRARGETTPPVGGVRLGDLRRTDPIDRYWGYDRGGPVDRYYIEEFLDSHRADIAGRVLEVGDDTYTRRFGGGRVSHCDVLHVDAGAPGATFVGDLASGDFLADDTFDAVVLTQTLHLIFDFRAAMQTLQRVLRPGGVLLLTVPGISPIDAGEWATTWHYSFTQHSLRRICDDAFGTDEVLVRSYGNVLAAVAFLHGMGAAELSRAELDAQEITHSVVHAARVRKGTDGAGAFSVEKCGQ